MTFLFFASTVSFADSSVQFFKKSQATRVVNYLNQHPEVLFYCGCYPDFQTSYVYTYDVWMERYSLTYYEVWIYGFNVKTNEEIYTPVDLNCLWVEGSNGYPMNVAQTLGFKHRICEATFRWRMPVYNTRPRVAHPANYQHNYFDQPNVKPRQPKPAAKPATQPTHNPKPNAGPATNNHNQSNTNNPKPQPNNNNSGNNNGNRGYNSGNNNGNNSGTTTNKPRSTSQPATTTTNNNTNSRNTTNTSNSRNSNTRK